MRPRHGVTIPTSKKILFLLILIGVFALVALFYPWCVAAGWCS